jgi:hypothetical protein
MKIVEVWPRGYAHQDGTSRLTIEDDADPQRAASAKFGSFARVSSVRPANPPVVEPVSEAYARMMSQHDNS